MSKTNDAAAEIEKEYADAAALIAGAVEPPLAQFRQATLAAIADTAKSFAAQGEALLGKSDGVLREMNARVDALAERIEDAADDMSREAHGLSGHLERAVSGGVSHLRDEHLLPLAGAVAAVREEAAEARRQLASTLQKQGDAQVQLGERLVTTGQSITSAIEKTRHDTVEAARHTEAAMRKGGEAQAALVSAGIGKVVDRVGQAQTTLTRAVAEARGTIEMKVEAAAGLIDVALGRSVGHLAEQMQKWAQIIEARVAAAEEQSALQAARLRRHIQWLEGLSAVIIALLLIVIFTMH